MDFDNIVEVVSALCPFSAQVFSDDFIHPQDCLPNGAVKLRRPIPVIRESVRNPGAAGARGRTEKISKVNQATGKEEAGFFSSSFKKDCG